jgi:hypothetical protein
MRQVEMPYLLFSRICRRDRGCIGEWIRNRQGVAFHDVLSGFQVPPEIRICDFGREQAQQADSREE